MGTTLQLPAENASGKNKEPVDQRFNPIYSFVFPSSYIVKLLTVEYLLEKDRAGGEWNSHGLINLLITAALIGFNNY